MLSQPSISRENVALMGIRIKITGRSRSGMHSYPIDAQARLAILQNSTVQYLVKASYQVTNLGESMLSRFDFLSLK
jgi:hypothetical protein